MSDRIFDVIVFIVSGFTVGVSAANIQYYRNVVNASTECAAISKTQARNMRNVNIIILIIALLVFIYSLFKIIFPYIGTSSEEKSEKPYTRAPKPSEISRFESP